MDREVDPEKSSTSVAAIVKARISGLKCSNISRRTWWKKPFYIKISLDGGTTFSTKPTKGYAEVSWDDAYNFEAPSSSSLTFQLFEHRILFPTKEIGEGKMLIQSPAEGKSIGIECFSPRNADKAGAPDPSISFMFSPLAHDTSVSHTQQESASLQARKGLTPMRGSSSTPGAVTTVSDMSSTTLNSGQSFVNVWGSVVDKLELFAKVADGVSEAIVAQQKRDEAVVRLMETVDDVYSFILDAERTRTMENRPQIIANLSAMTLECTYFIRDYSFNEKFRERMVSPGQAGVMAKIQQYEAKFKEFKVQFLLQETIEIDIMLLRCLKKNEIIESNTMIQVLSYIPYAVGANFREDKVCLPGTRETVLNEFHRWINEPDREDVPRLWILTGAAGFGKSALTNTLAVRYHQIKRLGSYVSFSRADQNQRNPRNLFSTISRNIADLDPFWRSALRDLVTFDYSLATSTVPETQMKSAILGPAKSLTIAGPVVIIVDALDESGDIAARKSLLQVLSKCASDLPRNFRVLVTARPETDIVEAFSDPHPHLRHTCLDTIDEENIDLDIAAFIEDQLGPIIKALDKALSDREHWVGMLVTGAKHSFQWAATTCRAIMEAKEDSMGYAARLITEILEAGESLDDLYRLILRRKFPERDPSAILLFKHVMGCILAAKEPLSKSSFMDLCCEEDARENFLSVLAPLGSLLNGVSDDSPITARHTSFFDFLVDEGRSLVYFINPAQYDQHFIRPCLRILSSGLRFNICHIPSSYTTYTSLVDLPDRVAEYIGPALEYASRFLGQHLKPTPRDQLILEDLRALFKEKFLYWLEVLSLLRQMSAAPKLFDAIHVWVQACDVEFSAFVKDTIRFVETFAEPISQSVPHIYLSALPFAPTKSLVSQAYLPQYPSTARLKAGKLDLWPAMLKTLEGHTDAVWAVAYSPDGKRIASASEDETIRVRDTETGEAVGAPFSGHTASIRSIAYSPSGHRIISGSEDGTIRMWEPETGVLVKSLFRHRDARCVAYSPDGNHIVSGSLGGTVSVWDVETGEAADKAIKGMFVAYSPDGLHIVSGQVRTVIISDVVTGEAVGAPLEGHIDQIDCVVYSPDGTLIASCSRDNTICLWDAKTRQAVEVLEGHTDGVVAVAFSPDGAHLVSASFDKTIRVWDVKAGKPAGAPLEGHASAVYSVAYSPDGTHIVSGSGDGTVRVWDAEAVGFEAAGAALHGSSNTFLSMAYSPDGASIVSGSQEGKIQMWDVNTGQLRPIPISGHHKDVNAVAFSPDGTRIVSGSDDCTLQVWDVLTGEAVGAPFKGHTKEVLSVAYSPDGSHVVSGSFDGTVRTWNVKSGEPLGDPFKHRRVWSVAYAPDGMHVVSGGAGNLFRIWNIKTSEQVRVLSGHTRTVTCVAYSPDGTRIVSGSWDNTLRLWEVESGEAIGSPLLGHDEMIESVAFSPDGRNIVSGSRDQTIRMWDAETREPVGLPVRVHGGIVAAVAYSPDGTRMASASWDNTIRIWDVVKMEARLENGWIVTASGLLLLWVPPWNRQGLVWPSNVALIGHSLTELDLADFVHGSDWVSCKADAKVVAPGL
ncbi:hypothetical protein HWV62_34691 [Athelia sp. TMB]|nr:hypothetical protein HWV62_34691 [Athelia sp. TMB]